MNIILTPIKDLVIVEPKVFNDSRGYFFEAYNKNSFHELGLDYDFVQDNQSFSTKGVLRGLHFQKHFPQAKLVRVIEGEVFDKRLTYIWKMVWSNSIWRKQKNVYDS